MLTDLLTDFWVSTSMTSPPVAAFGAGVNVAGSVLLPGLELLVVVLMVVLLELEMVFVAGSVGGSSVVVEKATLDSWR